MLGLSGTRQTGLVCSVPAQGGTSGQAGDGTSPFPYRGSTLMSRFTRILAATAFATAAIAGPLAASA